MTDPVPFQKHESGAMLHGTKAQLTLGDLLVPGHGSNYEDGRIANHIYMSQTLDAAAWGAELARGDGPPRIYLVEPQGSVEDDPNVTDKRMPGNPTLSFRTKEPVRIIGELEDWVGHTPAQIDEMCAGLAKLRESGSMVIED